jgi:hypothetical protein
MKANLPIVRAKFFGITMIVIAASMVGCDRTPSLAFNAEVWKNSGSRSSEPYPRLEMADDLLRTHALDNLDKVQVLEMLGDPGDHGYFKRYDLVYWLGPERSFFRIDSEWLAIKLNRGSGIVESYRIVRD